MIFMKEHKNERLDVRAEFATQIFLRLSVDVFPNRRMKKLVDVVSSIFMHRCIVIDWLDNHIHKKPIAIDIRGIS